MNFHLLHPRVQLVTIMNRIYYGGMTTLSGGNLSIKDENGDLWITPAGVDKGQLTPQDIMRVRADGSIEGPHRPSSEYPFHRAIYAQRPDLRAVVHAHPPALVSFSIARKIPETHLIPQAQSVCGTVGYAPYALPGGEQLGQNIAAAFAEGFNMVLLENHGIAAGGPDLLTAFQRLETLEFCARAEIRAHGLGKPVNVLTEKQLALFDRASHLLPEFVPQEHSSQERFLRQQIVKIVHRAYERQLMISTEGVVSARIDNRSFLITPTGLDRRCLDIEDIVLIAEGQREKGKLPSRSVSLHQTIYQRHPEIGCIITAQSPNIMAYAITGAPFDTRTIPESYILLRSVPVLPCGALYTEPEQVVSALSDGTPVVLFQNDCVLTVGRNALQAFDRLEVAEFSARALVDTALIGALVPMGTQEIRELEAHFPCG